MYDELNVMPYKKLAILLKSSDVELRKKAAIEIRCRRREKSLPEIRSIKEYMLTPNQKRILDEMLTSFTGDPLVRETDTLQVLSVSYRTKGGWVVYLTGMDAPKISRKIHITKQMIEEDIREFGFCRICFSAIKRAEWDGLLIRFDRGLRLIHE